MRMKIILVSLFLFLWSPVLCLADNNIFINEFLIDPQPQTVEIINTGSETVDLTNWVIDDNGGSSGTYMIASGTFIYPNSCLVFSKDFNLNKSSSDSARLLDSNMNLIDSYSYKSSPGNGISYARVPDGDSWSTSSASLGLFNVTRISCLVTPTPTIEATPTPSPLPTDEPTPTAAPTSYDNLYINEAMVNPGTGHDEWVEIYNNNDFSVNLFEWYIDDVGNAGSSPRKFTVEIPPKSYRAVTMSSSLFNNDGDTVRLLDFEKTLKDSFDYEEPSEGKTYGRISLDTDDFCLQSESFEKENNPCLEEELTPTITPKASLTAISPTLKPNQKKIVPKASSELKTAGNQKIIPTRTGSYEEVLGMTDHRISNPYLLIKHLSIIAISYSLLTVVSVLIKMTGIYAKRRYVYKTPLCPPRRQ